MIQLPNPGSSPHSQLEQGALAVLTTLGEMITWFRSSKPQAVHWRCFPLFQADLAAAVPAPALRGLGELCQVLLQEEKAPGGALPSAPLRPGRDGHRQ